MSRKRYVFRQKQNLDNRISIVSDHSYNAAQVLRKREDITISDWVLTEIVETTVHNRTIARIESDYRAMQPKNIRKAKQKEDT